MDSTVIGEDMEMQVVVVTHNVLPIRSLRWQNIPSLLFWSSTSGRRFGDDSLSHALSTLCFVLVACIDDFLLLMYTFLFLREVLFGPKWRPPLLILRRDKYFGQLNLDEGNIKEQWSIITLLSTGRFLIAHLVPIQFNRAHENFEYIGLSVEPAADLRSPYLRKETRPDIRIAMCNQTFNELCDKVKSRGHGLQQASAMLDQSHHVNQLAYAVGYFFFSSLKAWVVGGDKKKLENWNLTCLVEVPIVRGRSVNVGPTDVSVDVCLKE